MVSSNEAAPVLTEEAARSLRVPTELEIQTTLEKIQALLDTMKVDLNRYTAPQQRLLIELVYEFRDIFTDEPGFCQKVAHTINTGDHPPISVPPFREPLALRQLTKEYVANLLKKKLVRPSKSPWAAPVLIIPKKETGKWRFVVDYRKLNKIVPRDSFPLPRIDDSLALLGESEWFSVIDLVSGYWQIPVAEEDVHKTAFICSEGLYEWIRLPMGLSNSPATFQQLMQEVIPPTVQASYALVYMDEIIIHSKTFEDHITHLQDILDRLRDADLHIKPSKVRLARNEVHYLGHCKEGTKPDPQVVESVVKMAPPTDISELRSFLGLSGY
jgi:hypothetical protein